MPLVRSRRLRSLIGGGLVLAALLLAAAVLLSFARLSAPLLLAVVLGLSVASPFVARAMVAGRYPGGRAACVGAAGRERSLVVAGQLRRVLPRHFAAADVRAGSPRARRPAHRHR